MPTLTVSDVRPESQQFLMDQHPLTAECLVHSCFEHAYKAWLRSKHQQIDVIRRMGFYTDASMLVEMLENGIDPLMADEYITSKVDELVAARIIRPSQSIHTCSGGSCSSR